MFAGATAVQGFRVSLHSSIIHFVSVVFDRTSVAIIVLYPLKDSSLFVTKISTAVRPYYYSVSRALERLAKGGRVEATELALCSSECL